MRRLKNFGSHLVTSRYTIPDLMTYARLLDEIGFDMITIGDHTLIPNSAATYPNAQTVLGYMGAITNRVRLSTAVTDSLRRHPVEIAQATLTLDHLTKGRAMLGIGGGEMMNLEPFGLDWSRAYTRLNEAIDTIRLLWQSSPSSPADYDGKFFTLKRAYLQISPFKRGSPPPLYIGALGPKTRELVGSKADGWVPVAVESTMSLPEHLKDVKSGLARSGRKMEDVDVVVTFYTDIDEDHEKALTTVEAVAKSQLIQERSVLKTSLGMEIPDDLTVQRIVANDPSSTKRLEELASSIPRSMVRAVTVAGTTDECISRLEEYMDVGATSFLVCNLSGDQGKTFRQYAEKILPHLRENYGS